jgi:hypothetical protein
MPAASIAATASAAGRCAGADDYFFLRSARSSDGRSSPVTMQTTR